MRLLVIPIAVMLASGCATKKYMSREVGEVNHKLETLSASVEQTQARTRGNEARIEEVDRKAQAGVADARGSASQAMARATDAQNAARGKLLYTLTLSSDRVQFAFDRASLSDESKQRVNQAVAPLVVDNRGVFLEIEGHTDASGPEPYNQRLGEARALAVRAYLHDQVGIALNRMEVISYGSTRPVAGNAGAADRAKNRRVVINVLE